MSELTPALFAELQTSRPLLFGWIKITFADYTLRLLDGSGTVIMGGETYVGRDSLYGVLDSVGGLQDKIDGKAPTVTLGLIPSGDAALSAFLNPAVQGCPVGVSAGLVSSVIIGALAIDAMMISSALTPKPKASSGGSQDVWKADPYAGIPYVMGRTYVGGNMIYRRGHGTNNTFETIVTALSLGTIAAVQGTYADHNLISFSGSSATGTYANHIYQTTQLGACPEAAALPTPTDSPPDWNAARKLSGIAASMLTFKYDTSSSNTFSALPQMGWVVQGVKVYDPRLDSTYPGGSGSCRVKDESTYVYSENPGLHGLTWCIGRYQNGVRVAGIGADISTLDVASFAECANLCDARGWTLGGQVYTRPDPMWNSLQAILQAGGSSPAFYAGKISCINQAPRVSLATITRNDIVGDATFAGTAVRRDRINQVIPQYRSEDNQWQLVSAAGVSVADYVALDGDERTKEISYPLVQNVNQVAELALYDICDSREAGPGKIPCKPYFLNYRPGDCVTFQPEDGASIKVQITGRELDANTGVVSLDVRGETDSKHAFALGETTTPPTIASLSYSNAVAAPLPSDWSLTGGIQSANGIDTPALILAGRCGNPSADAVIFEYREHSASASPDAGWISAGVEAPTISGKAITAVKSTTNYDVAVRYRVRGILGDRLILGPLTSGQSSGGATAGQNLLDGSGGTLTTSDIKTSLGTSLDTAHVGGRSTPAFVATVDNVSANIVAIQNTIAANKAQATADLNAASSVANAAIGQAQSDATAAKNDASSLHTITNSLQTAINGNSTAITNESTQRANADLVISNRTSVIESTAGVSQAQYQNANPRYSTWPDASSLPIGWNWWSLQGTLSRDARQSSEGGYSATLHTDGGEHGIFNSSVNMGAGWYVLEADVWLQGGSWVGSGITLNGAYSLSFSGEADINEVIDTTSNSRRRFSKLIQLPAGSYNVHAMTQWSAFGYGGGKTLSWNFCGVRPASEGEIKAKHVSDSGLPNAVARIANEEGTRATQDSALGYRIDQTNAAVGNNQAFVIGQIQALSGVDGSLASQIGDVRATANGASAGVTTNSTAIADLNGRTAAYWSVDTVAGNGRAQLRVRADANGGGGVDIVGDLSVQGNVIVDGTVQTSKVADNAITDFANFANGNYYYGSNTTDWQAVYEIDFFTAYDAKLSIDVSAQHSYSGITGNDPWGMQILVDGGYVNGRGGSGVGTDAVSVMGATNVGAGWHHLSIQWRGSYYITLVDTRLRYLAAKR